MVGFNTASAIITNCYATGTATATNYAGGLVGYNLLSSIYTACITSSNVLGGVTRSRICPRDESAEISTGAHLTVAQMQQPRQFLAFDWDFSTIWQMTVVMPNIVGQTLDDAGQLLYAQGMTIGTVTEAYSATVAKGLIISQSVVAGTGTAGLPTLQAHGVAASPKTGDTVDVVVSLGDDAVVVPDVVGDGLGAAVDAIEALGLLTDVTGAYSDDVTIGLVISQDPDGGDASTLGSEVAIVVSLGVQPAIVPDVVGDTVADAIAAIATARLVASISYAYSADVDTGKVISQLPDAGVWIEPDSDVCIVVSRGIDPATIPSDTGLESGDIGLAADIADAVAAELNAAGAGTFSIPFTAIRRVLPEFELAELKTLAVTVVPKSVEISTQTRSNCFRDISVDIGIQKKLDKAPGLDPDVATIGVLADQITNFLRKRTLSAANYVVWVKTVNDVVYSPEHLAEQRVYTSVLTVLYRMMS
jgi:beta-lactam-binding protein with PASTA domain